MAIRKRSLRRVLLLALVLLVVSGAGGLAGPAAAEPVDPAAGVSGGPWAELVGPGFMRFVPGTSEWEIPWQLVGDGWGETPPGVEAVEVTVDGVGVPAADLDVTCAPCVSAAGRLGPSEVRKLKADVSAELAGLPPDPREAAERELVATTLAGLLEPARPGLAVISGADQATPGAHWVKISATCLVGGVTIETSDTVEILSAAIPRSPGWFPADLHIHTNYSDGTRTPLERQEALAAAGYAIGYLTDHSSSLIAHGDFTSMDASYPAMSRHVSDAETSVFPGAEMAVGHNIGPVWNGDGHSLAYGITSTRGLDDNHWAAQVGLDQELANNPPISSGAIAHPTHFIYGWDVWPVQRYYGIELMSGYQANFDKDSSPAVVWRKQCAQLAGCSTSFRPSVRTGSDAHYASLSSYVTSIRLPSDETWTSGTWEDRWTAVSEALRDGRTVISRKGSLAYLEADGSQVGSTLERMVGDTLTFTVSFTPIEAGTYNLILYENDFDRVATVWPDTGAALTIAAEAGTTLTWSPTWTVKPGLNYYWLYVSGTDYCYTTPIYVNGRQGAVGAVSFAAAASLPLDSHPNDVAAADLTGDGTTDLVATYWDSSSADEVGGFTVFVNQGDAKWSPVDHDRTGGIYDVAAGDLDGDGLRDLAITEYWDGAVTVFSNYGSAVFGNPRHPAVMGQPTALVIADLNNDTIPDIATVDVEDEVWVNLGTGGGSFAPATLYHGGFYYSQCLAAGDVDGDGFADLAVGNAERQSVYVRYNDHAGGFPTGALYPITGSDPNGICLADLDNDGDLDLATANDWTGDVTVLFNDGAGHFSEDATYSSGATTYDVVAADFDGDGDADLAAANFWSDNVTIFLNDGTGSFTYGTTCPVGRHPDSLACGDFNADGKPDLAVANYSSASVSVLLNTTPFAQAPPAAPKSVKSASAADGVSLTWQPPPKGTVPEGYEVLAASSSKGPFTVVKDVSDWSCSVTSEDYAFTPGQKLFFQVKSYTEFATGYRAYSKPSGVVSAVAGPVPPAPPTGLKARTSMRGVRLTWLAPVKGVPAEGYRIQVSASAQGPFTDFVDLESWSGIPSFEVTTADAAALDPTFPLVQGTKY